jgi:predicted phage gp36 major capsid-like protein
MATFDMTASSTNGVGANVVAVPTVVGNPVKTIEAILDIDAMVAAGTSPANGDVFQILEIPAESVLVCAGAEIMKSFTGSCTADIDFAGGDDIIDGAALDDAAGTYLVKGSNGEANIVNTGAASTFAAAALACVGAADTIDVKIDGAAPATGRLRVYAVIADISPAMTEPAVAQRDLL